MNGRIEELPIRKMNVVDALKYIRDTGVGAICPRRENCEYVELKVRDGEFDEDTAKGYRIHVCQGDPITCELNQELLEQFIEDIIK